MRKATSEITLEKFMTFGEEIRSYQKSIIPRSSDSSIHEFVKRGDIEYHLIIAEANAEKGRLLCHIEKGQGYIGWYECTEDLDMHNEIMDQAIEWFEAKGCKSIVGPVNGTTWGNYRFNLACEYPLFPGEPYQPLYYVDFWEQSGFESDIYYKTEVPPKDIIQESNLAQVQELLGKYGIIVEHFPKVIGEKLENQLYTFYDECFQKNPLYSLIHKKTYLELSRKAESILEADHSFLLKDGKGLPIAVFISFIDVYHLAKVPVTEHQRKKLIIKTIATHPNYQNKQIGTIMVNLIHNLAYQNGYEEVIHAMMHVGNVTSKVGSKKFQTKVLRTYALMKREL
jgi:GNAT superfamily N-acetyltransferase